MQSNGAGINYSNEVFILSSTSNCCQAAPVTAAAAVLGIATGFVAVYCCHGPLNSN